MGKLTETLIQQWMQEGKPVAVADGEGLTFTLSAKGTAAWTLRYRIGGKRKELTLGRYPAVNLEDARKLTEIERTKIALGRDVCAEKQEAKRAAANAPRIEALRREVAKLESDLRRFQRTAEAIEIRLNAAREALRIESEGGAA
jgi:predicted RNase H-like nuclease (RuvC/YqgF family)